MPLANDITRRACEIIHDPASWTPTASARDESGGAVSPLSPRATKFCGLGALVRAAHELRYSERWLIDIFGVSPLGDLVRTNHLGHAEVLAHINKLGGHAIVPGTLAARSLSHSTRRPVGVSVHKTHARLRTSLPSWLTSKSCLRWPKTTNSSRRAPKRARKSAIQHQTANATAL